MWVSISDDVPNPDVDVLCFYDDGTYLVAYTDGVDWLDAEDLLVNTPDFWMFLPEPPYGMDNQSDY